MNSFAALEEYLQQVKKRWQATVATRGLGIAAAGALILTILCVLFANRFAFAPWSVVSGRTVLYLATGALIALALVRPLLELRRRNSRTSWVKRIANRHPAFGERIETFVDQKPADRQNPMLGLLAEDTLRLTAQAPPEQIASSGPILTFSGIAVTALAVLIWLGVAGPGYLRYGTARLWGGWLRPTMSNLYQLAVEPGSTTIRRRADLLISARTIGFYSPTAHLFAKYASSAKWEEAPMQRRPDDSGFEFQLAGVDESLRYYVVAGSVKSPEYDVKVVEMPSVKKLRLTYHYPSWTGLADSTQEPGGDVRAVAGTEVDVEVETDRPLTSGALQVDGQASIPLRSDANWSRGRLAVQKDGRYFVAALYNGEVVRLSDDFFIEAVPDQPPTIKVVKPARDAQATSIEEVPAQFEAEDDFGLKSFDLHYSVNGGPEKIVNLRAAGGKQATADYLFALESFSLVPGDVISYYAAARDAKVETKTDMYFIEVQPFEREYYQAQQMGGGGGAGGEDESSQISRREKEIVAATWNLARDKSLDKQKAADAAKTLAGVQSKLRDQTNTLAERMKRRQLANASGEFQAFVKNMEQASAAMGPAAEQLSAQKWEGALPPEQKALQYLLRAEAIFRQIQVAFGNQGGGGGGGMGRDLSDMFNLELDTEKNQYETGQQASAQERDRELDQALEKLRELARRQEQLAEQQRRQQIPNFDQRWQQEMLRREAEELTRQLQRMQQQQQNGRQSAQGRQGGQQVNSSSSSQASNSAIQRTLERLQAATRDMQQGSQSGQNGQAGSDAERRAAIARAQERLKEAEQLLSGERQQRAGEQLEDMEQRASELASRQQALANKLRDSFRQSNEGLRDPVTGRSIYGQDGLQGGPSRQEAQAMAREEEQVREQLQALEKQMQEAARRLAENQPKTSRSLRNALSNMQQAEPFRDLGLASDYLKRGLGPYALQREQMAARALNQLRDGLQETRRLAQNEEKGQGGEGLEQALNRVEQLRQQIERAMAARQAQQQGQGQQQGQQQGQAGQQGQGQQGQGQQQGPGQQAGGAQQGGGGPYGGWGPNGGYWRGGAWAGWNGRDILPPGRFPDPIDPNRVFREAPAELSQIEGSLRNDPDLAREVEELRKQLRMLPGNRPQGGRDLSVLTAEQQKLLQEAEDLELLLRRKLDEKQGSQVRAITDQPIPEGYRKAVAEYFRRLSREK